MSEDLSLEDHLVISIALSANYNDGNVIHIQKDYLRSAIKSALAKNQASEVK